MYSDFSDPSRLSPSCCGLYGISNPISSNDIYEARTIRMLFIEMAKIRLNGELNNFLLLLKAKHKTFVFSFVK